MHWDEDSPQERARKVGTYRHVMSELAWARLAGPGSGPVSSPNGGINLLKHKMWEDKQISFSGIPNFSLHKDSLCRVSKSSGSKWKFQNWRVAGEKI